MPHPIEISLDVGGPLARYLDTRLDLPVLPEAASQVIALCQDPNVGARDVERVLERDPSLASHVLRIANSAMFAPVEPIASLKQAVGRLGTTTIQNLALAASLERRVFVSRGHEELMRRIWAHSALTAVFTREVARRLCCNAEVAFLWGLMHDVGRPLVLQASLERPELLRDGRDESPLLEAVMETCHARIGAKLVRAWGLPEPTALVVACHHLPELAKEHARDARMLRLGDLLAHWAIEEALDVEDFPVEDPSVTELRLSANDLDALLGMRARALASALTFA